MGCVAIRIEGDGMRDIRMARLGLVVGLWVCGAPPEVGAQTTIDGSGDSEAFTASSDPELIAFVGEVISSSPAIEQGTTLHGVLDDEFVWRTVAMNAYRYEGGANEPLVATLRSRDFDAGLGIFSARELRSGAAHTWSATDDNGAGGTDARLVVRLPTVGEYLLVVTSHRGGRGPFELTLGRDGTAFTPERGAHPSWRSVTRDSDNRTWELDSNSARRSAAGDLRVWTRVVLPTPELNPVGGRFDRQDTLYEFDCAAGRWRLHETIFYLRGSETYGWAVQEGRRLWMAITPGSPGQALRDSACAVQGPQ